MSLVSFGDKRVFVCLFAWKNHFPLSYFGLKKQIRAYSLMWAQYPRNVVFFCLFLFFI